MGLDAWAVVVPRAMNADERRDQEKLGTSTGTGKDRRQHSNEAPRPEVRKEKRSGAPSGGVEESGAVGMAVVSGEEQPAEVKSGPPHTTPRLSRLSSLQFSRASLGRVLTHII
jgi:hypothetical protein